MFPSILEYKKSENKHAKPHELLTARFQDGYEIKHPSINLSKSYNLGQRNIS